MADNLEQLNEEIAMDKPLKVVIRLDFKATGKTGRFLFGGKSQEKTAEDIREQQVALFRNVPMQGVYIEHIDVSIDVFTVIDENLYEEVAYAPVVLTLRADTLEDLIPFVAREEFRKIEIIEPQNFSLSRHEVAKLFFKINQQLRALVSSMERKYLK